MVLMVKNFRNIFGPGRQVPQATLIVVVVVVVVVVILSSLNIPKAFLIRSGAQRNFAYTFVLTFPTDVPSQIFHLFSN